MKNYLLFIVIFTLFGCSNPYCNPQTSKAVDEREQTAEMKKQTQALEHIASDLDTLLKRKQ